MARARPEIWLYRLIPWLPQVSIELSRGVAGQSTSWSSAPNRGNRSASPNLPFMRRRFLSLAAVIAMGSILAPQAISDSHAGPDAPSESSPTSTRTAIVMTGSREGWAPMTLPRSTRVQGMLNFSGDGRLIAFVIVPDPVPSRWTQGPFLYGVSFGRCSSPGCNVNDLGRGWFYFGDSRLPPGNYRFYLVMDGARARVELPVRGLNQGIRLRAKRHFSLDVRTLTPRIAGPNHTVLSAGNSSRLTGPGLALHALWMDTSATAVAAWGDCVYRRGQAVPDESIAYLPTNLGACRTDAEGSVETAATMDGLRLTTSSAHTYLPKAIGAWYATAAAVKDAGAVAAWLKF